MVAGGPLVSVVLTLVCGIAFLRFGNGSWEWIGTVFWAGVVTVLSLVPYSAGIMKTDGAWLRELLTQPQRSRAGMAMMILTGQDANGVRPRDWDAELVELMLSGGETCSQQPWCELLATIRCEELREDERAALHIEAALAASARSGKLIRQVLFLSAAETSARVRGNAAQARIWLDRALKLRKPETQDSTEASIAMCEGRYNDALRHIEAARGFLKRHKADSGIARFAKEKLNEMEAACGAVVTRSSHP